jgi:hypothetical protein
VRVFRGRAFGLDLEADFDLPGMEPAGRPTGRRVRLRLGDPAARGGPSERIAEAPGATVEAMPGGFLARADGVGSAWIAEGGGEVVWGPESAHAQRFLGGQVLPFAAVLQGLEVFHASAVVVGGRALGIVAGSGVGKTTAALELVRRGLPFLDDDVLALDGDLMAHPGPALANVGEERVAVARHDQPVRLGTLCFLERGAGSLEVERLHPVDPKLLLAATFNLALRTPERLARQLEICGRIAESALVLRARCPTGVGAAELAERLHDAVRARELA